MSESIVSDKTYKIANAKAHTVLDLSGADNVSIIGYGFHGGANQQWQLNRTSNGWTIKNVASGLYLAINGAAADGLPITVSSNPFVWHIWPDDKDKSTHRICVPNTTQNIDLSDHGNPTPGTRVTLWGRWDGKHQTWKFEEV